MTCDHCGAEVQVGQWYQCPHEWVRGRAAQDAQVTWPGGRTFENLADTPQTFYAPSELQRYLKAHHLEPFVRHQPVPGTDKSPHTTNWAAVSQETLDGARAMLERIGKGASAEPPTYIQSMTVTVTEESGTVRAPRGTFDAA